MQNKVSIVIPVYPKMKNGEFFLKRLLDSIKEQTYTDYEIVETLEGNAPTNTNSAINKANGDIIKIMYQDDYFTHKDALQGIVEAFKGMWLVNGCSNNLNPVYMGDIHLGNNKLGGPSCLTISKEVKERFDENLVWLFDCDLYKRLYAKYGEPVILNGDYVTVGEGEHQATNNIISEEKDNEVFLMRQRYSTL